ncbi:50S ribosomal protein L30 [Candidatus Bathyarchaeota archaeon]|nr:MAG: 50S ribosomal protein L30 [Candidatus Bathyarchaeota archaeon]
MAEKAKAHCVLAVRLRGTVGDAPDVEKTMESLMLQHVFRARLLKSDASTAGMLRSVKALLAWGEPSPAVVEHLLEKRAERDGGPRGLDDAFVKSRFGKESVADLAKSVVAGEVALSDLWRAGLKPRFRLHPPRGGFRRSTRRAFTDGGELGYRGDAINSLALRMI